MAAAATSSVFVRTLRWLGPGLNVIPSLVQLAVVELIGTACIGAGVLARLVDHSGLYGHPPAAPLSWTILIWLAAGGWFMRLTVRQIWRPGVQMVKWSPVCRVGPAGVVFPNDPSRTQYLFLGTHPAYVLMDLIAGAIPAALVLASLHDEPRFNPVMLVCRWWLAFWMLVPLARLFCWHVLRRGPDLIAAMTPEMSPAQRRAFEWKAFWRGPLVFWAIALLLLIPGSLIAWRDMRQMEAETPQLTVSVIREIYGATTGHDDERYRLNGTLRGSLHRWPEAGGKYASAGLVVALEGGAEIAVFFEVSSLRAAEELAAKGDGSGITCLVRTLDQGGREIPPHYTKYYAWSAASLDSAPDEIESGAGRSSRMLTRYVDP